MEGLATIEEILDEARNGRMFVLVDDEDRENEGDLVIPAQMTTPNAVSFMASHGRGLICLAMTRSRADELGLQMMQRSSSGAQDTAFTVTIEAREGVTTGISAADRARTILTAIDGAKRAQDIVSPGHIFPLVGRDGGVLVRAGHTEAAIDISRLAGLNPSGVICEIMNDDGTMARLNDLIGFAGRHGLKIGTIRDLIRFRRRHDYLVERVASSTFVSDYGGQWSLYNYRNRIDGSQHLALQKGSVDPMTPTLVRMHAISIFGDTLGQPGPRKRLLQRCMMQIGERGAGVIVLLMPTPEGRLTEMVLSGGEDKHEALKDYGIGAQILADLDIHDMVLLTNSHQNIVALEGYGLKVVSEQPIIEAESSL
ncbi:3,4-dihydroxy-2-butanone-4-phosphate synthase [Sphingobium sp.]|uniref:3,4-dihydroxy-2-butanone-4-phosphate synthase n=1 Tax=Sphingobium sp. TaxID=1912891 RepID=UPI0028BE6F63|nr:3,4-dihydroxy-2-butanone-4-phosphate synthase [Sphingobium sp.]